jgi:hypothetical protein
MRKNGVTHQDQGHEQETSLKINLEVIHNPGATFLKDRVSEGAVDNFPSL